MYNYQAIWFGSKPQRKKPDRLTTAGDRHRRHKDVTQTGHPIICSYTINWVPALKCEMFNSFHCFVLLQVLLSSCFFFFVSSVQNLQCNFSLHMKFNSIYMKTRKMAPFLTDVWCTRPFPPPDTNIFPFLFFLFLNPHNHLRHTPPSLCSLFPFSFINPLTIIHRLDRKIRVLDKNMR